MKTMKTRLQKSMFLGFLILVFIVPNNALAQIGRAFWFAPPDLSVNHQETPIRFCVTTFDWSSQRDFTFPSSIVQSINTNSIGYGSEDIDTSSVSSTIHIGSNGQTKDRRDTITSDFLQIPNLCTPNGDGINDIWRIVNLIEFGVYPKNHLYI